MAKIIFEYDSVEDREEWEIHANAQKMYDVLHDFLMEFRSVCKHGEPTKRDLHWRERLNAILSERGVDIFPVFKLRRSVDVTLCDCQRTPVNEDPVL